MVLESLQGGQQGDIQADGKTVTLDAEASNTIANVDEQSTATAQAPSSPQM